MGVRVMTVNKAKPATPKFSVGQRVRYLDHTDRPQVGEVLAIEATWRPVLRDVENTYISYTVSHPSYRDRRIYIGESDLIAMP